MVESRCAMTIDVRPVNDPPVDQDPVGLNRDIAEDSTTEWDEATLLAPFVAGPDNELAQATGGDQMLRLSPTSFPTDSIHGGVVDYDEVNGELKLRYTPRADFNGIDEFVYTVVDDGENVGPDGTIYEAPRVTTKTVTVNVLSVNDKPRFSDAFDQQNLENDGQVSVPGWATNVRPGPETAADEESQTMQFVFDWVSGPMDMFETTPTAEIDFTDRSATLNYTLKDDVSGVVVFNVTLVDDGLLVNPNDNPPRPHESVSDSRLVTIAVEGVNNKPTFDLDTNEVTASEDSGLVTEVVISNVSPGPADEVGQTVSFEVAALSAQEAGLFATLPTISSEGVLTFVTAQDQNTVKTGPVVLSVTAVDSEGAVSEPVELGIAVTEVNDPPVAVADTLVDTDEDSLVVIPENTLLSNDIDPDLQTNDNEVLSVMLGSDTSAYGAGVSLDSSTGEITYDPSGSRALQALKPGQEVMDSFTYKAVDSEGLESGLVTVSVRVAGVNDAPRVMADTVNVAEEGATTINVLANDVDVDGTIRSSTVEFGLVPAFGTVSVNAQGVVFYRPFGELFVDDNFTYSVKDNLGARSEEAFVTISSNQPPVAEDDYVVTYISEAVLIDVTGNDTDADGVVDPQSVEIQVSPANGFVMVQPDGQVLYTPDIRFSGIDTFQYLVSDNSGRVSNVANVTVDVLPSRLQNISNRFDVNEDGLVTPIDPLRIINYLEDSNTSSIAVPPGAVGPDYFDVNGDGFISILDASLVINKLAEIPGGSGEEAPQLLQQTEDKSYLAGIERDVRNGDANDLVLTEIVKLSNCVPLVKQEVLDLLVTEKDSESDEEMLKAVDEVLADLL